MDTTRYEPEKWFVKFALSTRHKEISTQYAKTRAQAIGCFYLPVEVTTWHEDAAGNKVGEQVEVVNFYSRKMEEKDVD